MTTNRITKYFDEHSSEQEDYEEICDLAWRNMIENDAAIYFGKCAEGFEEFLFVDPRKN